MKFPKPKADTFRVPLQAGLGGAVAGIAFAAIIQYTNGYGLQPNIGWSSMALAGFVCLFVGTLMLRYQVRTNTSGRPRMRRQTHAPNLQPEQDTTAEAATPARLGLGAQMPDRSNSVFNRGR